MNGDGPGGTPANIILENGNVSEPTFPLGQFCNVDKVWADLQSNTIYFSLYPGMYFLPSVPLLCVSRDDRMSLNSSEYHRLVCPALIGSKLFYRDLHLGANAVIPFRDRCGLHQTLPFSCDVGTLSFHRKQQHCVPKNITRFFSLFVDSGQIRLSLACIHF